MEAIDFVTIVPEPEAGRVLRKRKSAQEAPPPAVPKRPAYYTVLDHREPVRAFEDVMTDVLPEREVEENRMAGHWGHELTCRYRIVLLLGCAIVNKCVTAQRMLQDHATVTQFLVDPYTLPAQPCCRRFYKANSISYANEHANDLTKVFHEMLRHRYPVLVECVAVFAALRAHSNEEQKRRLVHLLALPFTVRFSASPYSRWRDDGWHSHGQVTCLALTDPRKIRLTTDDTGEATNTTADLVEWGPHPRHVRIYLTVDGCDHDERTRGFGRCTSEALSGRDLQTDVPLSETFVGALCLFKAMERRLPGYLHDKSLIFKHVLPFIPFS